MDNLVRKITDYNPKDAKAENVAANDLIAAEAIEIGKLVARHMLSVSKDGDSIEGQLDQAKWNLLNDVASSLAELIKQLSPIDTLTVTIKARLDVKEGKATEAMRLLVSKHQGLDFDTVDMLQVACKCFLSLITQPLSGQNVDIEYSQHLTNDQFDRVNDCALKFFSKRSTKNDNIKMPFDAHFGSHQVACEGRFSARRSCLNASTQKDSYAGKVEAADRLNRLFVFVLKDSGTRLTVHFNPASAEIIDVKDALWDNMYHDAEVLIQQDASLKITHTLLKMSRSEDQDDDLFKLAF